MAHVLPSSPVSTTLLRKRRFQCSFQVSHGVTPNPDISRSNWRRICSGVERDLDGGLNGGFIVFFGFFGFFGFI
ncbi:uncharacterized protein YALI1_C14433g [Yarrowia lipolytica]|uniref:Uncharacterized protein n=1 Tax=Yarrowia lipolytica TaxID=4952 RepID=A0A1D8NAI3_YARLL|nr:hypothetical protein YALI1_C14433g [Yarrowia lipolytica]